MNERPPYIPKNGGIPIRDWVGAAQDAGLPIDEFIEKFKKAMRDEASKLGRLRCVPNKEECPK